MRKVLIPMFLPECIYRFVVLIALCYRKLRYGYTFRRIPLTQCQFAIVDPEDYKELSKYKWFAKKTNWTFYAERAYKNKNLRMHQEIMGAAEGKFVDHINHNGLDNRRANLRLVTPQQNAWNKIKQKGNCSSKYKGVHWDKSMKKWRARIICNGRTIRLGRFDSEKDAAKVYDQKAKEVFGKYAVLNFKENRRIRGLVNLLITKIKAHLRCSQKIKKDL